MRKATARLQIPAYYLRADVNVRAGLPPIAESSREHDVWVGKEQGDNESTRNDYAGYETISPERAHVIASADDVAQFNTEAGWVGSNVSNRNVVHSHNEACSAPSATCLTGVGSLQDSCKASQLNVCDFAPAKEQNLGQGQCQLQPDEHGLPIDHAQFPELDEVFGECAAEYNPAHISYVWDIESNEGSSSPGAPDALLNHVLSHNPGEALSESTATITRGSGSSVFSAPVEIQSKIACTSLGVLPRRLGIWGDASSTSSTRSTPRFKMSFPHSPDGRTKFPKNFKLGANEDPSGRAWDCSCCDCQFLVHFRLLKVGSDHDEHDPYLVDMSGSELPEFLAFSYTWSNDEASARTTRYNLERHRESIPILTLPKCFRDAITMTRAIGFQYLWVESLYIVHDDMQERVTQIMHMAQIYTNAFFILVALEKASSQSAWICRPLALQEVSFSARIIEIPQDITFESTLKDGPGVCIRRFLENRDDPWTPLNPIIRSKLSQSTGPEMETSFQKTEYASEQNWGKVDWPKTNNPRTDNDMFKFLFASILPELQVSISKSGRIWV
jgi:hypothetical protein